LETKEALDAKDIDGFARGVVRYWEQKKAIDPGATNEPIENLLASIQQDVQASLLPGAGGGGFIFMIAKTAEAAQRIRATLNAKPLNAQARFFDFAIDYQGLKITVL
jgi:fucokinase